MTVITGLERLLADPKPVAGKRIGILSHQAAITRDLRRAVDAIAAIDGVEVVRVFGPEHGFWGVKQDMEGAETESDSTLGIPLVSLYESTPVRENYASEADWKEAIAAAKKCLWPSEQQLRDLDALVVDLQDVGARYYTFANTMAYCMEVAKKTRKQVIVLDRPNPINGVDVEGNLLPERWFSFIGQFPIPARHGLTLGELATYFKHLDPKYDCKLKVVKMKGWKRKMWWDATKLPWVAPSPNMPNLTAATIYPGMCLVEATKLSEGRGTTQPFELFGAPGLDAFLLAERLNALKLPGVAFRAQLFKPMFQKHGGQVCEGVQIHVTDRDALRSYRAGLWVLHVATEMLGGELPLRSEPYEYEPADERPAINLLTGVDDILDALRDRARLEALMATFEEDERRFLDRRKDALLYT